MASESIKSKIDAFIAEKYIPLDNKIKLLIGAAILILPVILFYFIFFAPTSDKIQSLTNQKQSLVAEISKAKKAAGELGKIKLAMAETEKLFETTATLLPKRKEIPALLRNISDLGKNAGLDFLFFKPGPEKAKDFYAEIPVDISINGPYHNMGFFLDQVSKLGRIVTVDNIKMGSPHKEGGEMLLKSTCRLTTYRFTNIEKKQTRIAKK